MYTYTKFSIVLFLKIHVCSCIYTNVFVSNPKILKSSFKWLYLLKFDILAKRPKLLVAFICKLWIFPSFFFFKWAIKFVIICVCVFMRLHWEILSFVFENEWKRDKIIKAALYQITLKVIYVCFLIYVCICLPIAKNIKVLKVSKRNNGLWLYSQNIILSQQSKSYLEYSLVKKFVRECKFWFSRTWSTSYYSTPIDFLF